jgi:hypothetical protein
MLVVGANRILSLKEPLSGNYHSSASLSPLHIVIDRLEQCDRGESEYDHVREDGVWGEEVALVGWILGGNCSCHLDGCSNFLFIDHLIRDDILVISPVYSERPSLSDHTASRLISKGMAS